MDKSTTTAREDRLLEEIRVLEEEIQEWRSISRHWSRRITVLGMAPVNCSRREDAIWELEADIGRMVRKVMKTS